VQQGQGYFIVGFRQSVSDFSNVVFPWNGGVQAACTVCHQGQNADNWQTQPTFTACTSCHDNVMFSTAQATTPCPTLPANQSFMNCLHGGGAITVTDPNNPATCTGCHGPGAAIAVSKFHNQNGP
jgi:OmcA/MtrC family decaheme c-type cytochrome